MPENKEQEKGLRNSLRLFMTHCQYRDGAEVHGLQKGPGKQRQVLGPLRPGVEPKAQQQPRVSARLMLMLGYNLGRALAVQNISLPLKIWED